MAKVYVHDDGFGIEIRSAESIKVPENLEFLVIEVPDDLWQQYEAAAKEEYRLRYEVLRAGNWPLEEEGDDKTE
jgi:hypothetical protein